MADEPTENQSESAAQAPASTDSDSAPAAELATQASAAELATQASTAELATQESAAAAAEQPAGEDASAALPPAIDSAAKELAPAERVPVPRSMTGVVISNKADKTISVRIERRVKHPVYGKFIRRSTKLAAHDQNNACQMGDVVTILETRPISKTKSWRLGSIVERASAIGRS